MAKYTPNEKDRLREALIDFIKSQTNNESDEVYNYRKNLNYRAVETDVTGSLGTWGITHQ